MPQPSRKLIDDIKRVFSTAQDTMLLRHYDVAFFFPEEKYAWRRKRWQDHVDLKEDNELNFVTDRLYPYQEIEVYFTPLGVEKWGRANEEWKLSCALHELVHTILYELSEKKKPQLDAEEAVCDHIANIIIKSLWRSSPTKSRR